MFGRLSAGIIAAWFCSVLLWGQSVQLQWDASPDADVVGYNLYRSSRSGSGYVRLNSTRIRGLTYTDQTVPTDHPSYYVCTAVNAAGLESGYSNQVTYNPPSVNAPPVSVSTSFTTREDVAYSLYLSPPYGSPIEWKVNSAGPAGHGTVTVLGMKLTYTPALNYNGLDSFPYVLSSYSGGRVEGKVTVSVTPENDTPVTRWDVISTPIDQSVVFDVLRNDVDPDGDTLELVGIEAPKLGQAFFQPDGRVLYRPAGDLTGTDRFFYTVSDGKTTATGTIEIRLTDVYAEEVTYTLPAFNLDDDPADRFFVGFALLNLSDAAESVDITAFDDGGFAYQAAGTTALLPPAAQTAILKGELPVNPKEVASVGLGFARSGLRGFFMIGDQELHRLDGVGARLDRANELYLPLVECDAETRAFLQFLNGSGPAPARVELAAKDSGGILQHIWEVHVESKGSQLLEITDYCGQGSGKAYLEIKSDLPVAAIATEINPGWLALSAGREGRAGVVLSTPHIFDFPAEGTAEVAVLNFGASDVPVRVRTFDSEGRMLGDQSVVFPAHQIRVLEARGLLKGAVSGTAKLAGSLMIETASRRRESLLAEVVFKGASMRSMVPMAAEGLQDAVFLQVAHSADGSIQTGIGLFNPGVLRAEVDVEAFGSDGTRTAVCHLSLAPKGRVVDTLSAERLFGPDFVQTSGHLRVKSNLPVVSILTYSNRNRDFLSVVEPQPSTEAGN